MNTGQLALVSGAGLIGGFVNAIAGGGSLLLFPALVATGMGAVPANVTNSVALWPGYIGNVVALGGDDNTGRRHWPVYVVSALGAVAGCALLLLTPASAFDAVVPFLVLSASALLALQPRIKSALGDHTTDRREHLLTGVAIGGIYGGYFGGGLGVILMALLGLTVAAPLTHVNVLKGALQLLISTVALLVFAVFGPVHWLAALLIAPLSLVGGLIGGRFVRRLPEPVLRYCVVAFGVVVGIWLAVRAFG